MSASCIFPSGNIGGCRLGRGLTFVRRFIRGRRLSRCGTARLRPGNVVRESGHRYRREQPNQSKTHPDAPVLGLWTTMALRRLEARVDLPGVVNSE
jgi:hypothetical protein